MPAKGAVFASAVDPSTDSTKMQVRTISTRAAPTAVSPMLEAAS